MKAFVLIFALTAYAVSAFPTEQEETDFEYPRFITFPDGEGNPHVVDLEESVDPNYEDMIRRNEDINEYLLFTRLNAQNPQRLIIGDANSVRNSHFNPRLPTMVIVHGWFSKADTNLNPAITRAFLGRFYGNVIVCDWRRLAIAGYVTAANAVPGVGRNLGRFISFLNTLGTSYNNVHLVGFSLGAHVVGNAGRECGGRIGRITGLDPAGPLWTLSQNRMSPDDGRYVEAIHTDGGYTIGGLGIGRDVAQVDFYPNGGLSQPGCLTNVCNHNRAWEFFASSISYNHLVGNRCESSAQINLNRCRGPPFPMGNGYATKYGNGRYRVNTNRRYPF